MSTKSHTLPVYAPLEMRLVMSGVQAVRRPRPIYRTLFRISICNTGTYPVRLLGRKWTLRDRNGNTRIIEASKVFNDYPTLAPGAVFSCSGCHEFDNWSVALSVLPQPRYLGHRREGIHGGASPCASPSL